MALRLPQPKHQISVPSVNRETVAAGVLGGPVRTIHPERRHEAGRTFDRKGTPDVLSDEALQMIGCPRRAPKIACRFKIPMVARENNLAARFAASSCSVGPRCPPRSRYPRLPGGRPCVRWICALQWRHPFHGAYAERGLSSGRAAAHHHASPREDSRAGGRCVFGVPCRRRSCSARAAWRAFTAPGTDSLGPCPSGSGLVISWRSR